MNARFRLPLRLPLILLAVAALFPASAVRAGDDLPADLAFAPSNAIGMVHVRLADIWKSEHFKEWRDTVLMAGEQALGAFDRRFVPTPSSIDRLTVFVSAPHERGDNVLVVLTTTKPIDKDAFFKQTVAGAEERRAGAKTYHVDLKSKTAIYFINERTLAFGPVEAVQARLQQPAERAPALAEALAAAKAGKALVVGLNTEAIMSFLPPHVRAQTPPQLEPLLRAKLALATLDLAGQGKLELRLAYADAGQAADAEDAVQATLKMGRAFIAQGRTELTRKVLGNGPGSLEELPEAAGALVGLGALNRLEEFLAKPPIAKEGAALKLTLNLPAGGPLVLSAGAMSVGLLVPAVQKVRQAAARMQDQNNLKQMALAMHIYHDVKKGLPPAAICDPAGKPLLSWRVAILPYIEQEQLYRQFKLDEPWDSEHNRKLIPLMPSIYQVPAAPPKQGETHYRVFVGGGALFDLTKSVRLQDITDGTSNTIMITQTADTVVWTKPEDIAYDAEKPLPKMFPFYGNRIFNVAVADGSVRSVNPEIAEKTLRAMITRAGGETFNID